MTKHRFLAAVAIWLVATGSQAQTVVVANPAAGALSKDRVADIFLGKDPSHTPVDQSEDSPIYADFYKKAAGRDVAQVKAMWSRIIFTGKGQAPKQLPDSAAVKKAVAADPKALGYIEKSAVDGSVKVILTLE